MNTSNVAKMTPVLFSKKHGGNEAEKLFSTLYQAWNREKKKDNSKYQLRIFEKDMELNTSELEFLSRYEKRQEGGRPPSVLTVQPRQNEQVVSEKLTKKIAALEEANQQQKDEADKTINGLKTKVAEFENANQQYEAELQGTQAQVNELLQKIQILTETNRRIIETISANETDLASTKAVNDTLQKQLAETVKKLAEAEGKITSMTTEIDVLLTRKREKITLLDVINYTEIIVAVVGIIYMFSAVGLLISLPISLFYYQATRIVKKAESYRAASFAIVVCVILSIGFGFIHYNTAMENITTTNFPKEGIAVVVALVLSGLSIASLRQTYLIKEDSIN